MYIRDISLAHPTGTYYHHAIPVPIEFVGHFEASELEEIESDKRFVVVYTARGTRSLLYHAPDGFRYIKLRR